MGVRVTGQGAGQIFLNHGETQEYTAPVPANKLKIKIAWLIFTTLVSFKISPRTSNR